MKISSLMALTMTVVCTAQEGVHSLTESDKQDIEERLEKLLATAQQSSDQRYIRALTAYRGAIQSDVAAHELYLDCYEKVNFIDKQKSGQDFRDWKRKHKERKDLPEFRHALRHQLNWLLLSIEASAKPDEIQIYADKALAKIDTIMGELERLKSQQDVLKQNVLSSVYAKAYDINGLDSKDWPQSPTDINGIYETVVLPPLRNSESIGQLRAAWDKRIQHVGLMKKNWTKATESKRIGLKKNLQTPAYEQWLDDGYLKMLWSKEKDSYEAGDELNASNRMLSHIEKNMRHKYSLEWVKDFQKITGIGKDDTTTPIETTGASEAEETTQVAEE